MFFSNLVEEKSESKTYCMLDQALWLKIGTWGPLFTSELVNVQIYVHDALRDGRLAFSEIVRHDFH